MNASLIEYTTTRNNALIDPVLRVFSWEIPVYLFFGGLVAGMMVLGGLAMLRIARGDDARGFFSMQAPLLGFVLINLGMVALLLDLSHKLYVWRVFLTFQVSSPMSWGSWVLLVVYGVLMVSALIQLPQAWPWLTRTVPVLQTWSQALSTRPAALRALGAANIGLGVALGTYTGILLNTMVARPLWNSAVLGPLFLVSGLSAAAATLHIAATLRGERPAAQGMIDGAFSALLQPLGTTMPARRSVDGLIRADMVFLAVELVLIGLLVINLATSSASHAAALSLLGSGHWAWLMWGGVVALGIIVPLALQAMELSHRIPHTVLPALLVLAGGFTLRWVMVGAGQASQMVPVSLLTP